MKIGFITPGGDAPGMNACLRAAVRESITHGFEPFGIYRGYAGLIEDDVASLDKRSVGGIISRGGTILRSSRCEEIKTPGGLRAAQQTLKKHALDYLVVIGGDGSFAGACRISDASGIAVICIPASIDNDVFGTDETIGFDTAVNTAVEAIDKIRDTATSFERIFLIEVMGRKHGFLAAAVSLASGAEFTLVPEFRYSIKAICRKLDQHRKAGKLSGIIVFAEGCGDARAVAGLIENASGLQVRVSALGYIQRGGDPSARSRILATQFAEHAVKLIAAGKRNRVVVLSGCRITDTSIEKVLSGKKKLDRPLLDLASRVA
jgi:6-phosphofructokinase 1